MSEKSIVFLLKHLHDHTDMDNIVSISDLKKVLSEDTGTVLLSC